MPHFLEESFGAEVAGMATVLANNMGPLLNVTLRGSPFFPCLRRWGQTQKKKRKGTDAMGLRWCQLGFRLPK